MSKFFAALLVITLSSNACLASEADDQANSFAKIYASLCMKNLPNLEALREKLRPVPSLAPDKASLFLAGNPGDAWSVPDKYGTFVLVLPHGKNFCAVHVRRASAETAIKLFTGMVANPPSPFTSTLIKNEQAQSMVNGQTRTLSYEWSIPNTTRKVLFSITTATSASAPLQVLGSAAIISP
jgi:hypothetical protein